MKDGKIASNSQKNSTKSKSNDNSFGNLVDAFFSGFNSSNSNSNYSANTKNKSSNSSSDGYKSSFGNTYQYDLSNPIDQLKYKTDPAAQLRDRTSNQYMRELEGILKESGGGIIRKDNSIKWKPVTSGQPSWGNINNNSPTWDWVD